MKLREARDRIGTVWQLASRLGWPLSGRRQDFAFWRGNTRTPAVSFTADGRGWYDFGTGEKGGVIALLGRVEGLSPAAACRRFLAVAEDAGPVSPGQFPGPPRSRPALPPESLAEKRARWPDLARPFLPEQLARLAEQRHLPTTAGLAAAAARGLLVRAQWYEDGAPVETWGLTDPAREAVQVRRLDGRPWHHGKSKSLPGSLGGWPIGAAEAAARDCAEIVVCEGEPDLLAAFTVACLLAAEPDARSGAPFDVARTGFCCLAGGAKHIADRALELFRDRAVCLVPHADPTGRRSAVTWGEQLHAAGARRIRIFALDELVTDAGAPAKDLNDVVTARGWAAHHSELHSLFTHGNQS
jgi:hypothetical protein